MVNLDLNTHTLLLELEYCSQQCLQICKLGCEVMWGSMKQRSDRVKMKRCRDLGFPPRVSEPIDEQICEHCWLSSCRKPSEKVVLWEIAADSVCFKGLSKLEEIVNYSLKYCSRSVFTHIFSS